MCTMAPNYCSSGIYQAIIIIITVVIRGIIIIIEGVVSDTTLILLAMWTNTDCSICLLSEMQIDDATKSTMECYNGM